MANATRIGVILVGLVVAWQLHELRAELRASRQTAESVAASAESRADAAANEIAALRAEMKLGREVATVKADAVIKEAKDFHAYLKSLANFGEEKKP